MKIQTMYLTCITQFTMRNNLISKGIFISNIVRYETFQTIVCNGYSTQSTGICLNHYTWLLWKNIHGYFRQTYVYTSGMFSMQCREIEFFRSTGIQSCKVGLLFTECPKLCFLIKLLEKINYLVGSFVNKL